MKASVYEKYGTPSVVSIKDVEKPVVQKDMILVKIHAASINQADLYMLQGKPFPLRFSTGLFKPKIQVLGSDFSGVVEEVGADVLDYIKGDEVFGQTVMTQNGAYAEYAVVYPKQIARKPENVTHSEAAATPMAALTAIQALEIAELKETQKVLIYGASGGVGTYLIQVAKHLGAEVTAVCSTRNLEIAKSSGADHVIDYKKEQWDKDNTQYDVVVGANGYNKLKRYRDALTNNGTYVITGGAFKQMIDVMFAPLMRKKEDRKFKSFVAKVKNSDLELISNLLKSKALRPHIDKEFPHDLTKEALEHFYSGKTQGKTIIKINE